MPPGGNCSLELRLRQQSRKTSLLRDEAGLAAGVELADEVAEPVVEQEAAAVRLPVVDHEHAEILECVFEFTRRSTSSSGEDGTGMTSGATGVDAATPSSLPPNPSSQSRGVRSVPPP
jgi:hypothetical protein